MWECTWHLDQNPGVALVSGGCRAYATGEKITEAAKAREADLHTDLSDRVPPPRQQEFGLVQTRLNAKLVRGKPEHSVELPDEVERRHPDFSRDVLDRERLLTHLHQQLARLAETTKSIACQQHWTTSV